MKKEFVEQMRQLVGNHYPDANRIRVVLDDFSTHTEYAFYEFLPPVKARRSLEKLEFHFTPLHGSWLNMAEIELKALSVSIDVFQTQRLSIRRSLRGNSTEMRSIRYQVVVLNNRRPNQTPNALSCLE